MRHLPALFLLAILLVPTIAAQPSSVEDVLRAHVEAVGGESALTAVDHRYSRGEATVDTPMGPVIVGIEQWVAFPGHGLIKQTGITAPPEIPAEMLEQTIYITPDGGWIEAAQMGGRININDLPEAQAAGLAQMRRSVSSASDELTMLADDSLSVSLGESQTIKGTDVHVVEVGGEIPSKRFYAADTGLLFAVEATTPMGASRQYYSDYRTVNGIRVPFVVESDQAGQSMLITFSEVSYDKGITPETIQAAAEGN